MNAETLAARLRALGIAPPEDVDDLAAMAARRVARDTREVYQGSVSFPADTVEVEHEAEGEIIALLPNTTQRDHEVSRDGTLVRVAPAISVEHTLAYKAVRDRFDGTLAEVPTDLEDAVVYAAASSLSSSAVIVMEVATSALRVKKAASSTAERVALFEARYRESLP